MRNVIAVISGKGGVGKSTVAVNLAVALAAQGAKVALIDADFYGPSVPTLMGGGQVVQNPEGQIVPPLRYGVKYISIGFFLSQPDDPIIWRGPMFNKALNQMFNDVAWGEVDYCIVDMPPGTGDAALSLTQLVKLAGAVVVTTPQEVALADVRKAINMLRKVNVPILGLVENMAGFKLPDGNVVALFGAGGGERTARDFNLELLASIPLDQSIREGGDKGTPAACEGESAPALAFRALGLKISRLLDTRSDLAGEGLRIIN